jgi:AcrR family transcriptional regulator
MEFNEMQLQIMEKALLIFADKGYDNASVRDIAQKAGVNVAMISYYFGSKEKLLEAIFKNQTQLMKLKIESILHEKSADPGRKVDLIIDAYIEVIVKNKRFYRLMIREQVLLREGALCDSMRALKAQNKKLIFSAIRKGQKDGYFQKNIDTHMLAATLFGTVHHVFSNHKFTCEAYKIPEDNEALFYQTVIRKLSDHLKTMFKAFLTYGITKN